MSVSGSGFGAPGNSPTLEAPVACGIGTSPHRTVRRVAMDKANKTLAVIAAARALVAAPVGDLEARKRLVEALDEYDRSRGSTRTG
jgi:hypothetical protein